MNIKSIVNSTARTCKKYAPEILTGVAALSVIGSNVACAKNTRKYDKSLDERSDEIVNKLDKAAVWIECYWPTVCLSSLAILSAATSLRISKKRQATLLLALNAVQKKFDEYKKVLSDTNPDAYASQEVEWMKYNKKNQYATEAGPGEELFYEPIMDYYFASDRYSVAKAMSEANETLHKDGYISVYGLYVLLGAEHELNDTDSAISKERGWCCKDTFESGMNETNWLDWSDEGLEEVDPSAENEKDRFIRILKIMQMPNVLTYERIDLEHSYWG